MKDKKIVGEKIVNYPEKTLDHAVAAVDVVLFRVYKNDLQVILLKLKEEPQKDKWALPGGLVNKKETLDKAAMRHLKSKIGLKREIYLEQLYTFGDPDRDPLGWVISVAYIGLTSKTNLNLKLATRYADYNWFGVNDLPELAYDHENIVKTAHKRLVSKILYTNIIKFTMKKSFTLTDLQDTYELLLDKKLDKRNFRKKILNQKVLAPLNRFKKEGPQRPAKLYCFTNPELSEVSMI